jgi:hypothetical protein
MLSISAISALFMPLLIADRFFKTAKSARTVWFAKRHRVSPPQGFLAQTLDHCLQHEQGKGWMVLNSVEKIRFIDHNQFAVGLSNDFRRTRTAIDNTHFAKNLAWAKRPYHFIVIGDLDGAVVDAVHRIGGIARHKCRPPYKNTTSTSSAKN